MSAFRPLHATCHCGAVALTLTAAPSYINECNCSLCVKSGAAWGYFDKSDIDLRGATQSYARDDRQVPSVAIHFCRACGSTTHWTPTQALQDSYPQHAARRGVNMRLFDEDQLVGVELRFPDGRGWNGKGEYSYVRASVLIGSHGR